MKLIKFVLILAIFVEQVLACTTISYVDNNNDVWVLKSFDFDNGSGRVFINQRNVMKKTLVPSKAYFSFKKWKSKYMSVTFNQASRDYPYGGMNEEGLSVEIMWYDYTQYSYEKGKKLINESQVIQYLLDTRKNAKEAIEAIKEVNIIPFFAKVHYMICDKSNICYAVEFLNNKIEVKEMPSDSKRILQNSTYEQTQKNVNKRIDNSRFSTQDIDFIFDVSNLASEKSIVEHGFNSLESIRQGTWTKWQIVYNLNKKKFWFRTTDEMNIKKSELSFYEPICSKTKSTKTIDINFTEEGEIEEKMESFKNSMNLDMLNTFSELSSLIKNGGYVYNMFNNTCVTKRKRSRK